MLHITTIKYKNYKSFKQFSVTLTDFNVLVGPNNAGKSTIIGSLKILSEGLRKAKSRKPSLISDLKGNQVYGYEIDLSQVPVATENIFHNYDDSEPATIRFRLSDNSHLLIFFPFEETCYFTYESDKRVIRSPKDFNQFVTLDIGFVPVLGPVEHSERLYQKEAARLALLTHAASRNFRNIWYHYNEDFEKFAELVRTTWPGLDIAPPELNTSGKDTTLDMFCPEERIPREIYWAGFGFQVWCQMLTYIIKNKNASVFLIDEPDIYLHSDLQRQLLGILKSLGPDIIIATHSTELISEADINDILIINKTNQSAKRIKDPSQLRNIFQVLGSNLNPILTQIAKSKRVLFVEGKDFLVFSRIARILKKEQVANRSDFAVVPVEGFNPTRLHAFKDGIEKTIGTKIVSAVIFDKDYRSDKEVEEEIIELSQGNFFVHIHSKKEIENFLLVPKAIEKAITTRIEEINLRTGKSLAFNEKINDVLDDLSNEFKNRTQAQLHSHRFKYEKSINPKHDESTIIEKILQEFDEIWNDFEKRLAIIPGKDFLSRLNVYLQDKYKITITQANIINAMTPSLIPREMVELIDKIELLRNEINNKA
jgi:energy-coupling factor transporter ATP-binding protein EcfA2